MLEKVYYIVSKLNDAMGGERREIAGVYITVNPFQ